MRAGREEAADLLGKWFAERALLLCDFSFPSFRACFRGRVLRVSADELAVLSDDTFAELAVRLEPWFEFGYGDSRGSRDAETFEGILVIFFRVGREGEEADFISLTEIVA